PRSVRPWQATGVKPGALRTCRRKNRLAMTMWRGLARQNNPTGKSAKTCPALSRKIFRLTRRANQRYDSARLTRQEGRAHVTNARWDAVDAMVRLTKRTYHGRRSRVVLAPRCWR